MTQRPTLTLRPARNPVLDDPNVGDSDVCMDCRNDLADFSSGWQLCEVCRRARVRVLEVQLAPRGEKQPEAVFNRLMELWRLQEYIAWLNQPREGWVIFPLTDDLEHWAQIEVYTPKDLGDYLDECVAREIEKDRGW